MLSQGEGDCAAVWIWRREESQIHMGHCMSNHSEKLKSKTPYSKSKILGKKDFHNYICLPIEHIVTKLQRHLELYATYLIALLVNSDASIIHEPMRS